uniref:SMODS and SLOG-associating 2TM effector domain-containing protein n=1 Tax=Candidatus Kentrum sp. DK TaxID=2126562 RepID=A0A450RZY8_9GAMM|nr:MAG: hypothetical protein BECKDK2373B_GA0170837_100858 [Candidatus Kentron sp. DK]
MNHEIKKAIWRSMLDADMSARYWKYLLHRYVERDRWLKILLAVMTSGTVAVWGLWEDMRLLWQALSFISAALAISLPYLDYSRKIDDMSALAGGWGELMLDCEDLWHRIKNHSNPQALEDDYDKIRGTKAMLLKIEAELPDDEALLKKCQSKVKKARGLD